MCFKTVPVAQGANKTHQIRQRDELCRSQERAAQGIELHKALEDLVEYDKTFTDTLLKNKIQWTFNPPGASHFGGVWERMIRSVRRILVTLLHLQSLTDETLHTFMCEVEYILNNRPLTPVSADPRDQNPLSPNDILCFQETHLQSQLVYLAMRTSMGENCGAKLSTWQINFGGVGVKNIYLCFKKETQIRFRKQLYRSAM